MSVVFFDADELGNVAAFVTAKRGVLLSAELCAQLAAFSAVNARAFNARYPKEPNKAEPWTADDIRAQMRKGGDGEAAAATAGLLNYNCHEAEPTAAELQNTLAIVVAVLRAVAV